MNVNEIRESVGSELRAYIRAVKEKKEGRNNNDFVDAQQKFN